MVIPAQKMKKTTRQRRLRPSPPNKILDSLLAKSEGQSQEQFYEFLQILHLQNSNASRWDADLSPDTASCFLVLVLIKLITRETKCLLVRSMKILLFYFYYFQEI